MKASAPLPDCSIDNALENKKSQHF